MHNGEVIYSLQTVRKKLDCNAEKKEEKLLTVDMLWCLMRTLSYGFLKIKHF